MGTLPEIVIRLRSFIEVRPFTDVHKYVTDVHKRENVKVVCLMFPYTHIRILTAANVLRALRASRERSACSQQTSEKLSSNWKHALETRG